MYYLWILRKNQGKHSELDYITEKEHIDSTVWVALTNMKSAVLFIYFFIHVLRDSDKSHHPVSMAISVFYKHRDMALKTHFDSIIDLTMFRHRQKCSIDYYPEIKYYLDWIFTWLLIWNKKHVHLVIVTAPVLVTIFNR